MIVYSLFAAVTLVSILTSCQGLAVEFLDEATADGVRRAPLSAAMLVMAIILSAAWPLFLLVLALALAACTRDDAA